MRMTYHRPRSAAEARVASRDRAVTESRRASIDDLRDAIAPRGLLEVDGIPWDLSMVETPDGWIRITGQVRGAPIRITTSIPREGRALGSLASELRAEVLEHIEMAHDRVAAVGARIVMARATPYIEDEENDAA